jgi:hypothetical protein
LGMGSFIFLVARRRVRDSFRGTLKISWYNPLWG